MGSRYAIDRSVRACQYHPNADLVYFTREPSQSRFSFANGQQSNLHERLVIHFKNDNASSGWVTTTVDILDQGDVPILFSVAQMRNLRMNIEHTPVGDFMTCSLFAMNRSPLPVSTSDHKYCIRHHAAGKVLQEAISPVSFRNSLCVLSSLSGKASPAHLQGRL